MLVNIPVPAQRRTFSKFFVLFCFVFFLLISRSIVKKPVSFQLCIKGKQKLDFFTKVLKPRSRYAPVIPNIYSMVKDILEGIMGV